MEQQKIGSAVHHLWANDILPSLAELVAIPALSPAFDAQWSDHGYLAAAVEHLRSWAVARAIPGAQVDTVELPGRTPLLLVDIPATERSDYPAGVSVDSVPNDRTDNGTVLIYGHLDKQPAVGDWSPGLGPWTAVHRDDKLFGRGSADDGYAGYAALAAVEAVRAAGGRHSRVVVLLETGEESGSPDLPFYLEHLTDRLGQVSFVICLDSGGQDYERLWLTTSLRGLAQVHVTVRVLESAQHSGLASGVVPSSFRILRQLIERIENSGTGEILLPELYVDIPTNRHEEAKATAAAAPGAITSMFPLAGDTTLVSRDEVELLLNNTWRPTLSVIGADGFPSPQDAGNVLRDATTLALSFRLPPTADSSAALSAIQRALTTDVPYSAQVELTGVEAADGWNAPELADWLADALNDVSQRVFSAPWRASGLGGSIPFMALLAEKYPDAQFLVTGALGADSNAHVPDEWLHLGQARRVTEAVAHILHAHALG